MSARADASFQLAAKALADLGDAKLKRALLKGMREAAAPVGRDMVAGLAGRMPRRKGLAGRVQGATPVVQIRAAGSSPRVMIGLRSDEGYDLGALDRGALRHPVYGRGPWVTQPVPAKGATEAFERDAPRVRDSIVREVTAAIQSAAAKGSA